MLMPVHVIEPLPVACSVIPPALETVEPSAGSAPAYTRSAGGGGGTGVGVGSGAGTGVIVNVVELPVSTGVLVASIVIEPVVVALNVFEATPLEAVASLPPVNVPSPVEPPLRAKWTTVLLSLVTTLPAASRISTVSVRDVPVTRSEVALVKVRWSAAPWTIVKVVVPLVSELALAVIVIEPASAPVTVFVAMPAEAVAAPSPVTVPVPAVLAKVTLVVLSPVRRLPAASRTSAVRSRFEPDARFEVALVKVRWSAAPATIVNVVVPLVSEVALAVIVMEPASAPVTCLV